MRIAQLQRNYRPIQVQDEAWRDYLDQPEYGVDGWNENPGYLHTVDEALDLELMQCSTEKIPRHPQFRFQFDAQFPACQDAVFHGENPQAPQFCLNGSGSGRSQKSSPP